MKICPVCDTSNEEKNQLCRACGRPFRVADLSASGETVHASAHWHHMPGADARVRRSIPVDALFEGRRHILIGRSSEADVYLPHSAVSRFHAELERGTNGLVIHDRHSVNGVLLNGHRIQEAAIVKDQDRFGIGPFLFHLDGGRLLILDNSKSLRLQARNLEKVVRDTNGRPKRLLDNISLVVEPGEFISLLGPSGSGKSTLMDCLNGRRPATGGLLLANGESFYLHFNSFRQSLGYVPQKDIVHAELSVYRALYYTALLRLPNDTDEKELHTRITDVIEQMELTPHQHTLIRNLSGGQIKRVSLGAELIARPCLLFIDEATSGLDAGTEARMMRMFRSLANEGKSVICITHNVDNVNLCNLILVLARGKVIFYGPPTEALAYFGVSRISDIYDKVQKKDPAVWERLFLESPVYQVFVKKRLSATERMEEWSVEEHENEEDMESSGAFTPLIKAVSSIRPPKLARLPHTSQFSVLLARNLELIWRDRSTLRLLLLQAPLVAFFILLGFSQKPYNQKILAPRNISEPERATLQTIHFMLETGYAFKKDEIEQLDPDGNVRGYLDLLKGILHADIPIIPERMIVNPIHTYTLLFLIVIIVLWFGCNNAAKEIVKENAIYNRERSVNLGVFPYLSSKFVVLSGITALQTFLLMLLVYGTLELLHWQFGTPVPWPDYRLDYLEQFGLLVLLAMTGVALGLFISSCVSNPDQANTLLPYVLIPQVILGGGVLAVRSGPLLYVAMTLSPAYWAFRGIRLGECDLPEALPIRMPYQDNLWLPCVILAGQTLFLFVLTMWILSRRDKQRS